MQVSVETTRGLERKLTVSMPSEQFQKAYDERIKKLSKTAKLAGFRPGKVPLKVIQQKYGKGVKDEVLSDLVQRSYAQAISQEKLHPAGHPQIDAQPPKSGESLTFTAIFEIYPEVKVGDLSKVAVTKPKTEVTDKDIDSMLERLRLQHATWNAVDRAAKSGDQIKIDFTGSIDNEVFEGGTASDFVLELGSKRMIEGFEDQLEGIKADERRTLKVKFPKDYGKEELKGKKAQFEVTCKEVMERKLPEIDDTFINSYGVEDGQIESLRKQVHDHMSRELEQNIKIYTKRQLMDQLIDMHKIDLPNVLVDQEVQLLQQQTFERMGLKDGDLSNLPREPFEEEARRRVTLALIVGEIVKQFKIKVDPAEVKSLIEKNAASYQNPEQMVQYYLNNRQALQHFENLAIEDSVIDKLLEGAKISEKSMTFDDLLQANQAK